MVCRERGWRRRFWKRPGQGGDGHEATGRLVLPSAFHTAPAQGRAPRPGLAGGGSGRGAHVPRYLIAVYRVVFVYRINCRGQCGCVVPQLSAGTGCSRRSGLSRVPSPSRARSSPRRRSALRSRSRAASMRSSSSRSSTCSLGPLEQSHGRTPPASPGSSRKRTRRSRSTARRTRLQRPAPSAAGCWSSGPLGQRGGGSTVCLPAKPVTTLPPGAHLRSCSALSCCPSGGPVLRARWIF